MKTLLAILMSALLSACNGNSDDNETPTPVPDTNTSNVPSEFESLYNELQGRLNAADQSVSAVWDGQKRARLSGWLMSGNSNSGPQLLTPQFAVAIDLEIQALKALGMTEVIVEIGYPLLTPAFHNAAPYIQFYKTLATKIRNAGLGIIVEHNTLFPGHSTIDPLPYFATLTKNRFGNERYQELKTIISEMNPDAITLVMEPSTHDARLGLTLTDWTGFVGGVASQLRIDFPGLQAKLGAGCGMWESESYTNAFAGMNQLDFVELHTYPLVTPSIDYIQEMRRRADVVKAIDSTKELYMVEGWLYKASIDEMQMGVVNDEIFARDIYSFWAPLDQKFLDVMLKIGHHHHFSVIAPVWTRYYQAYVNYGDPVLEGLTSMQRLGKAGEAAFIAMANGVFSPLGEHFKKLAQGL